MKNVMKKLTGLLLVLVLALFAGCSDVDDGAKKDSSETKYTVSGRVLVGGTNGATASKLFSSASATRSATSSFETEYGTASQPLQVKATKGDSSFIADVDSDGVYSLVLPEAGTWDLEISKYMYEDEALGQTAYSLYGTAEVTVSTENDEISNNDIVVYPKFYSGIKGALNLTITDRTEDSKISKVSCTAVYKTDGVLPDESAEKINGSLDFTSGSVTISQNNVPAGTYELTFSFEDASGNVLYSCKETVTVFSGWTTDTWFGESPYMQKDDDGKYSFVITDALIAGYGTETVTASQKTVLYEAYSETTTTANGDVTTSGYKYYLSDGADTNISSLTANVTTTKNEINSFCFDTDGNVYVLGYDTGNNKYVISSTKYADISIDSEITSLTGITIDKTTNILYAYYGMQTLYNVYKFTNLVSAGSAEAYETISNITFSDIDEWFDNSNSKLVVNNGMIYGFANGPKTFYKVDLAESSPVAEKINLDLDYSATVTDMLYQDGAVYILLRLVSSSSGIYSTGALLRYDVKFGTVKTLIGLSEPVDLSGVKLYSSVSAADTSYQCYTDSTLTTPFYAPADFTWTVNEEEHTIFSSLYTPSLLDNSNATLSTTGFYGPVKFVAIKPRKLVIADDGLAFYTDNDGVLKYKNVSRVVTVDLESFAITNSTETDAIFGENNSAMLNISFENDSDFQEEFNSSSDVFPNLEAKVYYSGNTQGVAPGDSFRVGIPCAD